MTQSTLIKVVSAIQSILGSLFLMLNLMGPDDPAAGTRGWVSILMIVSGVLGIRYVQGERGKTYPLMANAVLILVQLVAASAALRLGRSEMEVAGFAIVVVPFVLNLVLIGLHRPKETPPLPEQSA